MLKKLAQLLACNKKLYFIGQATQGTNNVRMNRFYFIR